MSDTDLDDEAKSAEQLADEAFGTKLDGLIGELSATDPMDTTMYNKRLNKEPGSVTLPKKKGRAIGH